jgi:hypothetical protein
VPIIAVHDATSGRQTTTRRKHKYSASSQRMRIVETEDINDTGGASNSPEMKEYLLHDIMEPH